MRRVRVICMESHLQLEDSKHERLVLRDRRRKNKAEVKWIKCIMDESLLFRSLRLKKPGRC